MNVLNLITICAFAGQKLPYQASYDNTITVILLGCFFVTCLSLSYSRKFLLELGQNFIENKTHVSAFSTSTNTEINSLFLLILQSCALVGVTLFLYLQTIHNEIVAHISTQHLVGIISGVTLLVLFIKWLIYSFIGWIFNQKEVTAIWLESYTTIVYYLGLVMYPIVLYMVFNNTNESTLKYLLVGVFILAKMLILYKGMKLFSNELYGRILLILYFCALEIIPYALIYKGVNNYIMF